MDRLPSPPGFLNAPQSARASLQTAKGFSAELEVRTTPAGLLAVGALVAAILLSVPPIIRAGAEAAKARGKRSEAER